MRRFLNQPLMIGEEITLQDEDYNYLMGKVANIMGIL